MPDEITEEVIVDLDLQTVVDLDPAHFITDPNEYINSSIVNRTNLRLLENIRVLHETIGALEDNEAEVTFADKFKGIATTQDKLLLQSQLDKAFERIDVLRYAMCSGYGGGGGENCVHFLPETFTTNGENFSAKLPDISSNVWSEATALKYHTKCVTILKMRRGDAYIYSDDPKATINGSPVTNTYLMSPMSTTIDYEVVNLRCYCEYLGGDTIVNWVVDSGMGSWRMVEGDPLVDITDDVVPIDDITIECVNGGDGEGGGLSFGNESGGGGTSSKKAVHQPGHPFKPMDAVKLDEHEYVFAQADHTDNADAIGIVETTSVDDFVVVFGGITSSLDGIFVSGADYYLSVDDQGMITSDKPTLAKGNVEVYIGTAISDVELLVNIDVGYEYEAEFLTDVDSGKVEAGMMMMWPEAEPPIGWLIRNGGLYEVALYQSLFHVIGYHYGGAGDFFAVPDDMGLFERAVDFNGLVDVENRYSADGTGVQVTDVMTHVGTLQSSAIGEHSHPTNTVHDTKDIDITYLDGDGYTPFEPETYQPYVSRSTGISDNLAIPNTGVTGSSSTHPENRAYLPIIKI